MRSLNDAVRALALKGIKLICFPNESLISLRFFCKKKLFYYKKKGRDSQNSKKYSWRLSLAQNTPQFWDGVLGRGFDQRKGNVEWISIHFSEARGRILFCGHADPAFLFSSQASTKIKGPESQFGTRILGFYLLTMWIVD